MSNPKSETNETPAPAPSDFIRDIVAKHVAENKYPRIHGDAFSAGAETVICTLATPKAFA